MPDKLICIPFVVNKSFRVSKQKPWLGNLVISLFALSCMWELKSGGLYVPWASPKYVCNYFNGLSEAIKTWLWIINHVGNY